MGRRIKVTGYIDVMSMDLVDTGFYDPESRTGLTEEGYDMVVHGEGGDVIELADLEDLDFALVPE